MGTVWKINPIINLMCVFSISMALPFMKTPGLLLVLGVLAVLIKVMGANRAGLKEGIMAFAPFVITAFVLRLAFESTVMEAVDYSFKLFLMFFSFWALASTTDPGELRDGLTAIGLPSWFVLSLFLLIKNVEEGRRVLKNVKTAQMARGADFSRGCFIFRFWSMRTLVVPLIMWGLSRAEELPVALNARGFSTEEKRTSLSNCSLSKMDVGILISTLVAVVLGLKLE